jgi:hypothetical protein
MKFKVRSESPLKKRARRGFRGYPVATVAYYGPDDRRAGKVAVGIIIGEDQPCTEMRRWFAEDHDIRSDQTVEREIVEYMKEHGVLSVVAPDQIIGCPHEEGPDYPEGEVCPQCPFWANRDRWEGVRPEADPSFARARELAEMALKSAHSEGSGTDAGHGKLN